MPCFCTVLAPRAEKPVPSERNCIKPVNSLLAPAGRSPFALEVRASSQTKQACGSDSVLALEGARNLVTQLRHSTWPHFSAMSGWEALPRVFMQEGQMRLEDADFVSSASSVNLTAWSPLRLYGCCASACEAGHIGTDLTCFASVVAAWRAASPGVCDGVQNEGSFLLVWGDGQCQEPLSSFFLELEMAYRFLVEEFSCLCAVLPGDVLDRLFVQHELSFPRWLGARVRRRHFHFSFRLICCCVLPCRLG